MREKYRLALDMGTNSIGWACYFLDKSDEPSSLLDCGVRIFNDGRNEKSKTSLKADRRLTRLASRRRDRFLRRQKSLMTMLVDTGFMPETKAERTALELKDPWQIRKIALAQEVAPYDIGRALFHINQRRGFKSNRIAQDSEDGVVNQSIADFKDRLNRENMQTVGEFLANRFERKESVRARRSGTKKTDTYDFYPERSMLEDEVDALWEAQKQFKPSLYTEDSKDKIKNVIFHQRPLKPQTPGKCQFLPDEYRAAKALPSFQRFRIYQELANLSWRDQYGNPTRITEHHGLRDAFARELEVKRELTFVAMRKIMKKMKIVDYAVDFNLENERRKGLAGNLTSCTMRSEATRKSLGGIGADIWDQFTEIQQDELILLLLDDQKSDEDAAQELADKFAIPEDKVDACLNLKLENGHGSLSLAAIKKILPILIDQGLDYSEAVKESGLGKGSLYDPNSPLADKLEYYGKALEGHVVGGTGEGPDEKAYGTIPNPTVHIALNQLRQVTNELIRRFGKPYQIAMEIGRDLPLGAKGKSELFRQQKEGQEKNQKIRELVEEQCGGTASREDRQKYRLWEQLAKDPSERRCVFSGKQIGIAQLFSADVEIEHLLPYALTLDDTMANKTVCFRQANKDKGRKSPHQAFGNSPNGYDWLEILERAKNLPKSKQWRFESDAMERFEDIGGFLERHKNDMRYISRYTRQYLTTVVPENQIWVVTGQLTAMLRKNLGLESVLHDHNQQTDEEPKKKNRNDHRHHAVDAIVIGLISRSMLQNVSSKVRNSEQIGIPRLISELFSEKQVAWSGFREDVKQKIDRIVVSHRPRRKNQGSLHNETAYGLLNHNEDGPSKVVHRIPIDDIKNYKIIDKIKDVSIKQHLLEETYSLSGTEFASAVTGWCNQQPNPIRRIKIVEPLSVIPIKNKQGHNYKAYKGDGNAFMDIYEHPVTGKWAGETVSRFDANRANFIPKWQREHPELKRKMRLRINDVLSLTEDGVETLYRIQKMSGTALSMATLQEANVDSRSRDKRDSFDYKSKSPSSLQSAYAHKLHTSPTGLIRREQPR